MRYPEIYIGAFLELTNIYYQVSESEPYCPTSSSPKNQSSSTFCSTCGSKIEYKTKMVEKIKPTFKDSGEFVKIPDQLLQELGWNQYTILNIELVNRSIRLSKKIEWTTEELQEGDTLDKVIDDVVHNQQVHYIIHNDKKYVIRPYDEAIDTTFRADSLTHSEYLQALEYILDKNWKNSKCSDCGDTGVKPVYCCPGVECGCQGRPVDFTGCSCGVDFPSDKEIQIAHLILTEKKIQMKNKLKPCPFCGSKKLKLIVDEHEVGADEAFVYCQNCPALMHIYGDSFGNTDLELKITNEWNRRET